MQNRLMQAQPEQPATERQICPPRVFISYTHETPDHKRWVAALGTDLRKNGVDATLDQWDLALGGDATLFMEKGIREADRVLLICTPTYARKANEGQGGVGYERMVVTGELAQKLDTTKFVCVLRAGSKEESVPAFAKTRIYIDFCDDAEYEVRLEDLLRDIHKAPLNPRPPVGANPFLGAQQVPVRQSLVESSSCGDTEVTYARATALLRARDWMGWKALLRQTRRDIVPRLLRWRESVESRGVSKDRWKQDCLEAVQLAEPLMVLALCAVDSEHERIRRQLGLLDDLLRIPQWEPGGHSVIVEMPGSMAFFYHHMLGAFLVDAGYETDAVDLLTTNVAEPGLRGTRPLWQASELMGWPGSLGGNCLDAWNDLVQAYERMSWLSHFFTRPEGFQRALEGYRLLGSLIELCHFVSDGGNAERIGGRLSFNVPVPFGGGNLGDARLGMAVPNADAVEAIISRFPVKADNVRQLWPDWYLGLAAFWGGMTHRFWLRAVSRDDVPPLP